MESIISSLIPELNNLPEECRGVIKGKNGVLAARFECLNTSKLLALNNSFIGVLTMLLEIVSVIRNERENSPPRGTTAINTVSDT